ncbi:MAG: O-antigen ligase family protein [Anaerolineales bacterium]
MNRLLELSRVNSRTYPLALGLILAAVALALGALLGFAGPVITAGVVFGLIGAAVVFSHLEVAIWAMLAIITLLPFGSLPFKVVFTPTFLDLAILAVVFLYAIQWMTGERRRLTLTPAHTPIAVFMGLMIFSFVVGYPNGPLTSNLLRQFAEMLLSIAFAFILVDYLDTRAKLARLAGLVILGGAALSLIGIVLYALPDTLAESALSALRVFNYPEGGVLRYIEDNPENAERAIATAVDPNALGGMLAMIGALAAPQLLLRKPLLGNRVLTFAAFGLITTCLILTFSRGAMAALVVGLLLIAAARYRRMLIVLAFGAALILVLPVTQDYVARFVAGAQGQDLATQMRFGEYKDAFILINRYPVLGVGFSGAPEIDIYLGVSNAYLLIASKMGLVGLSAFLLVIAVVYGWAVLKRKTVYTDDSLTAIWLGLLAGLAAALTVGLFDHYFFNLTFQAAGTLFWMFVGLSLAATRLGNERQ